MAASHNLKVTYVAENVYKIIAVGMLVIRLGLSLLIIEGINARTKKKLPTLIK